MLLSPGLCPACSWRAADRNSSLVGLSASRRSSPATPLRGSRSGGDNRSDGSPAPARNRSSRSRGGGGTTTLQRGTSGSGGSRSGFCAFLAPDRGLLLVEVRRLEIMVQGGTQGHDPVDIEIVNVTDILSKPGGKVDHLGRDRLGHV